MPETFARRIVLDKFRANPYRSAQKPDRSQVAYGCDASLDRNIPASPQIMEFRHRVAIEDSVGRVLYFAAPEAAQALISQERAVVQAEQKGRVAVLRLVDNQAAASVVDLGLWPGSYGIHREHSQVGVYFEHKRHWGAELAA